MLALWRTVFALALVVTTYLTLAPLRVRPPIPDGDKIVHVAIFAADAFLGLRAFPQRGRAAVVIGLMVLGGLLEFLQGYVPYRHASLADAVANTLGVVVAAVAMRGSRRPPADER